MVAATGSGVPGLDEVLRGGWERGDNVVWLGADIAQVHWFASAFLEPAATHKRLVCFGGQRVPAADDVEVLDLSDIDSTYPITDVAVQVLDGVAELSRVVIDGINEIRAVWGASAAVEFYRKVCPEMLSRGAMTYWTSSSDRTSTTTIDQVTKVSQCVIDVRDDRLRVVKAEGHPTRVTGMVLDVDWAEGRPVVGREHPVGRVGEGLRQLRKDRNLTQRQVANLAGVTPAAISQAETGRRGLSLETIIGLSEAAGIGVDDLLGTSPTHAATLARHDRIESDGRSIPLLTNLDQGLRATLVRLEANESGKPPVQSQEADDSLMPEGGVLGLGNDRAGSEIVLVSSGLIMVEAGDQSPVVRPGDAFRTSAQPITAWHNLSNDDAEFFWLALP